MICVSVAERELADALSALKAAEKIADLCEIRLDALESPSVLPFLEKAQKGLIFTFRAVEEGGFTKAPLKTRLSFLKEAARAGAFAVDLELAAGKEAVEELRAGLEGTKLLLSFHDFAGLPAASFLKETVRQMKALGADLGKVVTTAKTPQEALTVLNLIVWAQEELDFPLIAFAMGKAGVYSRLVAPLLGAPWTYAALPGGRKAAPGQLPADVMRQILNHFL